MARKNTSHSSIWSKENIVITLPIVVLLLSIVFSVFMVSSKKLNDLRSLATDGACGRAGQHCCESRDAVGNTIYSCDQGFSPVYPVLKPHKVCVCIRDQGTPVAPVISGGSINSGGNHPTSPPRPTVPPRGSPPINLSSLVWVRTSGYFSHNRLICDSSSDCTNYWNLELNASDQDNDLRYVSSSKGSANASRLPKTISFTTSSNRLNTCYSVNTVAVDSMMNEVPLTVSACTNNTTSGTTPPPAGAVPAVSRVLQWFNHFLAR